MHAFHVQQLFLTYKAMTTTNYKKTMSLIWLSAIAIALFSIILSFYTTKPAIPPTLMKRVLHQNGIYGQRKLSCDSNKWNSRLVSEYGVQLVLTVDQNGCGNFSTLQKAVDAVPASSLSYTLIILDSGSYR